ncbi:MAG: twin-arginine translocase subunit TatC [Candidatus Aureabacteria bacterium]|nr:twin-arginine translocase subunit TatC [Candidatus Auribacterota bacterium]
MSGEERTRKTELLRPPEGTREPPARRAGRAEEEKPFLEHLEDLRWTLLKCIGVWGAATAAAFALSPRVLTVVRFPLVRMLSQAGEPGGADAILRSLSPAEVFLMSFKISALAGLVVSLPFILYFAGRFILPALTPEERRFLLPAFLTGGGLFFAGVLFAYGVILPVSLGFFWSYTRRLGIRPEWTIGNYASLFGQMLLGFGLAFEFPIVILFLAKIGVVNYDMLKRFRPYAVVLILIVAGVLTPPDVLSQVLMAIPLLALYEASVYMSRFLKKKRVF